MKKIIPIVILIYFFTACNFKGEKTKKNIREANIKITSSKPFSIQLTFKQSLTLKAILRNQLEKEQNFLHDSLHQPSKLILFDLDGHPIEPFDDRAIKKYDPNISYSMFQKLPPHVEVELFATRFILRKNKYTLSWGPYKYKNIEPGKYKASILWSSACDSWFDQESGKNKTIDNIWKGEISSNQLEFQLPEIPE